MKKKVLIIGPIGDFGGREVEVNIIASSLEREYNVGICSTVLITKESFALKGLKKSSSICLDKQLFKENTFIKCITIITYLLNKCNGSIYKYVNNSLNKKIFKLENLRINLIETEILKSDLVLLPMQLGSAYLNEITAICNASNTPVLFRTSGTVSNVSNLEVLKKITCFIHHSKVNAHNLNKHFALPFVIIDQCALNENILKINLEQKVEKIKFGYLGRFSKEKGILFLIDYFKQNPFEFIFAGEGKQKDQILNEVKDYENFNFLGVLSNAELDVFFKKIDVLIISSREETGPLVGLEAMAAGKIIISTNVGAMLERLENTSNQFWFKNNIKSLEEVIQKVNLLSSLEIYKISKENRERYLDNYSKALISEKYLKLVQMYI